MNTPTNYNSLPAAIPHTPDAMNAWDSIPEHLRPGLARYFDGRIMPGSFLAAVLENNLRDALRHAAPDIGKLELLALVLLLTCAPRESWGSQAATTEWVARRFLDAEVSPLDPNAALKIAPVVSTDCKYADHSSCEGEESALWPDGTFSMRRCSCPCHAEVTR